LTSHSKFVVSFRLLTEYHSFLVYILFLIIQWGGWVSVSLRSIIHSYFKNWN